MARRSEPDKEAGPETGPPSAKRKSRAKVRLVADNSADEAQSNDSPAEAVATPATDDSAPLTLDLRPAAPRRASRTAPSTAPSPASAAAPEQPSIPAAIARPQRSRRRVAAGAVLIVCIGGALTAGLVKAVTARHHRLTSVAPAAIHPGAPEARPILADYAPPNRDQVRRAYLTVWSTYHAEGLSGVVRKSMDCYSALAQTPSYPGLDYCIAVDAYGEALQRKLGNGQTLAADSYYTSASIAPRELAAARGVVSADGDPGARVLDVRRLAGEVSQDDPSTTAQIVAENDRNPGEQTLRAASAAAPQVIPSETPPGAAPPKPDPVLPAAPHAHPAVQVASAAAPARAPVHAVLAPVATAPIVRARVAAAPAPKPQRVAAAAPPLRIIVRDAPQKARVQRAAVAPTRKVAPAPHLTRASASVAKPKAVAKPKLIKTSAPARHAAPPVRHAQVTHTSKRWEHAHPTRVAVASPAPHGPSLRKIASRVLDMASNAFHHRRDHVRDRDTDDRDARPVRVAARAPITRASVARAHVTHDPDGDRYAALQRRAAEPAEWVDCRHPRGASELRLCEGPTSGGGTLEAQYRQGHARYR